MIKSFKHKGLKKYFYSGDRSRINSQHAPKLSRILDRLDASVIPKDLKGVFKMIGDRKPTHPGEILRKDVIKPLGLTVTGAAKCLGVTRKTLSALLNCKVSLSPDMAVRISKATKTTPESWLLMQAKLDLWNVEQKPTEVEAFEEAIAL